MVLCGVWDNTHRGGVCDCDGVLGTRIKSQPPEANGLICLDQDQARGESDNFWWKIQLASGKSTLRSKYDGVLSKWSIETQKEHKRNKMNGFYISFMMFQLSVRISGFLI